MGKKLDITGERYGALVALYPIDEKKNNSNCWMFKCDCGNEKALPIKQVRYGSIKSCGCHINKNKPQKRQQRVYPGEKFGKLTVIELLGQREGKGHFFSRVRCDCGTELIERDSSLISGRVTQCRTCTLRENGQLTHGMTNTRRFNIWQSMRARCYNPNDNNYKNYGGRGIGICDEWKDDFVSFYNWSNENGYSDDLTIDRIDVNGDYCPENCRWADKKTQARNKRTTRYLEYEGKILPICEISEITGIAPSTITQRIDKGGWDIYRATHVKPKTYESYLFSKGHAWKIRVMLKNKINNEDLSFESMTSASKFLGHGVGYLSIKHKRTKSSEFEVGDYLVMIGDKYLE